MKLIKLDAIDSTNIYVKELIAKGDIKNYTAVISKYQTNGRGRNNSIWQDEPSKNLNFTLYKEFNSFKIENKFLLNIISSISVFKLLKKYNLKNLSVKWPNDIMTGNKKISLATIYNTVEAFNKAGYLKEILTNGSKSYFDTNIKSHHHFYDEGTKELTDINYNQVKLSKVPMAPKGKKIKNLEVVIRIQK